jgi:hypothetical protein
MFNYEDSEEEEVKPAVKPISTGRTKSKRK